MKKELILSIVYQLFCVFRFKQDIKLNPDYEVNVPHDIKDTENIFSGFHKKLIIEDYVFIKQDETKKLALNQCARELLLAQSSDWLFIITNGTMYVGYPR